MLKRQKTSMVVFDCDGVLVDTVPVADQTCVTFFNQMGLSFSIDEFRMVSSGRDLVGLCQHCCDLAGLSFNEDIPEQLRSEIVSALKDNVIAIPGVVDVVRRLDENGKQLCVASSGSVSKMKMTLGAVGLLPVFEDLLFSAQDCGRGKPYPDVFLTAAKTMKVDVGRCLVVEDTLEGVQAAKAADMHVLGFARDSYAPRSEMERSGARLFDNMEELEEMIDFFERSL